jgi:DNA-binding response OmpR family regulator
MTKDLPDKKILIVEDDPVLSASLREEFESEGFNVLIASDGAEGLEIVKKEKPDLVLIDILLPKLDGISMAKEINKLRLGTSMIFLSNLSDAEHVSEAIAVGMADYLVKSDWKIADIVSRVKQKLGL